MAYDEDLANRIREVLAQQPGVDEKPMFGGLAFLIGGHMAVAASGKGGVRGGGPPGDPAEGVARGGVSPMVMAGRETRGWLRVDADGVKTQRQLGSWISHGVGYARSLPPK